MWFGLALVGLVIIAGPVLAAIFAVSAYYVAPPDVRGRIVPLWALAGLTLPLVPAVGMMGPASLEEAVGFSSGIYDSYRTPLGHGYYLTSINSSGSTPYLYLPGEVVSSWPVERVGCAGENIVLQSREDSLYGYLTADGHFSEMNDIAALGPVAWSPEGRRELAATCEPEPPRWLGGASLALFILPFPVWLGLVLWLTVRWSKSPR